MIIYKVRQVNAQLSIALCIEQVQRSRNIEMCIFFKPMFIINFIQAT